MGCCWWRMLPLEAVNTIGNLLPARHVLCLGYPQIKCCVDELNDAWGIRVQTTETVAALKAAGCQAVTVVDAVRHKGMELVRNLNDPQPLPDVYDLIIDPGTLEHCFNVGQAFAHVLAALDVGGRVYHIGPVSMVNHGFWNVSPTAVYDWYEANGCEVEMFRLVATGDREYLTLDAKQGRRRFVVPAESTYRAIVRKVRSVPLTWPVQAKYLAKSAA